MPAESDEAQCHSRMGRSVGGFVQSRQGDSHTATSGVALSVSRTNLTEEVAKLRQAKDEPYASSAAVLGEAQKVADCFSAYFSKLRESDTEGVVKYMADNTVAFKELVEIKTGLTTSIALCEEHDRRTRPNRLAELARSVADAPNDTKLWLPTMAEYRRAEHEARRLDRIGPGRRLSGRDATWAVR